MGLEPPILYCVKGDTLSSFFTYFQVNSISVFSGKYDNRWIIQRGDWLSCCIVGSGVKKYSRNILLPLHQILIFRW